MYATVGDFDEELFRRDPRVAGAAGLMDPATRMEPIEPRLTVAQLIAQAEERAARPDRRRLHRLAAELLTTIQLHPCTGRDRRSHNR